MATPWQGGAGWSHPPPSYFQPAPPSPSPGPATPASASPAAVGCPVTVLAPPLPWPPGLHPPAPKSHEVTPKASAVSWELREERQVEPSACWPGPSRHTELAPRAWHRPLWCAVPGPAGPLPQVAREPGDCHLWRGVMGARGEASYTQIASEWPPHLLSPPRDAGRGGSQTCGGAGTGLEELQWNRSPAGPPPKGPTHPIVRASQPSWRVPRQHMASRGSANGLPRGPGLYGTHSRLPRVLSEQAAGLNTDSANRSVLRFQEEPTLQSRAAEPTLPHERGADAGRAAIWDGPRPRRRGAHRECGLRPWTLPPGLGAW